MTTTATAALRLGSARIPTLTRESARRSGVPLAELLGSSYTRFFHDTYVPASVKPTVANRAQVAVQLFGGRGYVSHHTAVQLWGGVAPPTAEVHLSFVRGPRGQVRGISAHRAAQTVAVTTLRNVPISSPVQAFLDLASVGASLVDLVIAGDSLVKATRVSPDEFMRAAGGWRGNNARRARQAAALIRAGVDSPMETKLRLLIVLAGLPEPTVNLIIRDSDGEWTWRFDLSYERWKLIIEYDGRQHAFDDEQWGTDLRRREALDAMGWRLLVVRAAGLHAEPERTLMRIREALVDRGATGVPRRFRSEWSRHFPIRA